jgi:hypothetical protein
MPMNLQLEARRIGYLKRIEVVRLSVLIPSPADAAQVMRKGLTGWPMNEQLASGL